MICLAWQRGRWTDAVFSSSWHREAYAFKIKHAIQKWGIRNPWVHCISLLCHQTCTKRKSLTYCIYSLKVRSLCTMSVPHCVAYSADTKVWCGVFLLQYVAGGLLVVTWHIACCSMQQIIKYSLFITYQSQFWLCGALRTTSRRLQLTPSNVPNSTQNCDALSRCLHLLLVFRMRHVQRDVVAIIVTIVTLWQRLFWGFLTFATGTDLWAAAE